MNASEQNTAQGTEDAQVTRCTLPQQQTAVTPRQFGQQLDSQDMSGAVRHCPLCSPVPSTSAAEQAKRDVAMSQLSCGHEFCTTCLRAYVDERYGASWSVLCPECGAESAPPWGVWHLCLLSPAPPLPALPSGVTTRGADPRPFDFGMCSPCAASGWFSAAGRRCIDCATVLCDTCAYTHVLSSGTSGMRQEHRLEGLDGVVQPAAPRPQEMDADMDEHDDAMAEFHSNNGLNSGCRWEQQDVEEQGEDEQQNTVPPQARPPASCSDNEDVRLAKAFHTALSCLTRI